MIRKTIEHDEEYLRQTSKPVNFQTDNWKEAINRLDYFCKNYENNVLAMAAIQIGIPLRLIYLKKTNLTKIEEDYNEARILINPTIIKRTGATEYWEACVSCLDNTGLVERPYEIEIEYYDEHQNRHHETFQGFESTVLSHEIDHLDGILHIDISKKIKKLTIEERKKLREKEPYKIIRKDGPYHPQERRSNMQINELNQKELLEKISNNFQESITSFDKINFYLKNVPIEKLPINITTGNHEVYKICLQGNIETDITENGFLFLLPGSRIKKHYHPMEKGITEIYKTKGMNNFHWQDQQYEFYECLLDKFHGVDIEDTPRIIEYIKTNERLKNNTTNLIKQKKRQKVDK